jgi:hypothetical protein
VPPAYDIHPEFGYFCPAPRARRELRVAVVSILAGMAIGAAIMAIHAGQAAETEAVSGNAQLKSSAPDPLAAVPAASPRIKDADKAKAVEAIEPYPMRMVRVRPSKPASPLAGIPLGRSAPPAAPPPAQSSEATAEPAVSGTKKRPSAVHARRHRDDENENMLWQDRRWPYWGERTYAEDRYWRGAYRNWVY